MDGGLTVSGLVLRFSDYEADTVTEHSAVLSAKSRVWWGWWKKRHEDFRESALSQEKEAIAAGRQMRIGLVDRASRRCFVAICLDLRYFPGGEPISSPDADLTPAYYRDRQCPVWFLLSGIISVSMSDWSAEFGNFPVGDDTLFPLRESGHIQRPPRIDADGVGILHLSDLHFGSSFAFPLGPGSSPTISSRLEDIVAQACRGRKPAIVVVSGDITTRGEHEGFVSARKFLLSLLEKLHLDVSSLVIVPGNHDILVDELTPTRDYSIEQAYRDFIHLLYGSEMDNERVQWIRDTAGTNYIFSLVNSSRPRSRSTMDYGYVGSDRSEPVLRAAGEVRNGLDGGNVLSTLVLHHHVMPAPMLEIPDRQRPVSLTLDAGELVTLAHRYGVDVVLHGHQHLPFIGQIGRIAECGGLSTEAPVDSIRNLWVIGAGSTGASVTQLWDEMRNNSFGLYWLDGDSLEASVFEFSPNLPPRQKWTIRLPLSRA
jgi:predicted MPP superfamily phosphohydrolase